MKAYEARRNIQDSRHRGAAMIVDRAQVLERDDLIRQVIAAQEGSVRARECVIDGMSLYVLGVAQSTYLKWAGSLPASALFDDVFQAGLIGVVHGINGFKDDQGYAFTTYADAWIRRDVLREIYRHVSAFKTTEEQVRTGSVEQWALASTVLSVDYASENSAESLTDDALTHETIRDPNVDVEHEALTASASERDWTTDELLELLRREDERLPAIARHLMAGRKVETPAKQLGICERRVYQLMADGKAALQAMGLEPLPS